MAAVHEAGHVVTARQFGLEILSAWIVPNDAGPDERTWAGRVQIKKAGAPEMVCRMVGCAGSVAEWLWGGGWIEDYFPEMSESGDKLFGVRISKSSSILGKPWVTSDITTPPKCLTLIVSWVPGSPID